MSGNSCLSALQTAPIVIDFAPRPGGSGAGTSGSSIVRSWVRVAIMASLVQVGELVFADLKLVAVLEPARVHALAVDVGAVQRSEVVEVVVGAAAHDHGVVARHGHVVEEDVGVGAPAHAEPLGLQREGLAGPPTSGADDQRRPGVGDHVLDLHGLDLPGLLVDTVGGRGLVGGRLGRAEEGAALLAVVGPLVVDEPALGAVDGHGASPSPERGYSSAPAGTLPARMSVSLSTSVTESTSSPLSCFLRSRLTSSARRMSILPCRMRRRWRPRAPLRSAA